MKTILVVEDSPMVAKVIRHVLGQNQQIRLLHADSLDAATAIIESEGTSIFAAIVDLNLPDAPNGEVVDYVLGHNLPAVVLTGVFDAERRVQLLHQGVVDYVIKEGRYSYTYVAALVYRLIRNEHLQILAVDDSDTGRQCIGRLLRLQRYQVVEAADGPQAIKALFDNPSINLMITDFHMPRMDGCELVKAIRGKYEKSDLVIIGLSSADDESLSARFIKSGANDFLRKPFNHEEFFCRVSHNMDMLELMSQLRDNANRDLATGAYNRQYFFSQAEALLSQGVGSGIPVAAAVIDLDKFRDINCHHGNLTGDQVIRGVVAVLLRLCERFLLARAGGQEFYVLMVGLDDDKACAFVERVRQIVANDRFADPAVAVTFSAGVATTQSANLDQLMQAAGAALVRAKEAGGDLVFGVGDD